MTESRKRTRTIGLRAKTMFGSLLPVTMMLIIVGVSYTGIRSLADMAAKLDYHHGMIQVGLEIELGARETTARLSDYLRTGKKSRLDGYEESYKLLDGLITATSRLVERKGGKAVLTKAKDALHVWKKSFADPAVAREEGVHAGTKDSGKDSLPSGDRKTDLVDFNRFVKSFIAEERSFLEELRETSKKTASNTIKIIIAISLVILLTVGLKNLILAGRTTKPLEQAVRLAEAISEGDLSRHIKVKQKDEVGRLFAALNHMVDIMRSHTGQILEGVGVLGSTTEKISDTVGRLATTTAKTAAAITQTTTTVEQVKQAAEVSSKKAI
ncbi:HAMP domain-containing protein [Thermodesulfobacteriota bacterium]